MSTDKNRKELLKKLSRNLMVSVPMMTVVAVAGFNASSGPGLGLIPSAEAAQGEAEGEARGEAEGEAKGEAEGSAKGEGEAEARAEGEAEGHAEGEGEAEGEGVSAKLKNAVRRPEGYTPYQGNVADLRAQGEKLFNDTSLSSNGLSCATCHANGAGYNATFKNEYPHVVAMGQRDFGMDMVHLDEMVQICMVAPMAAEPLEWGSEELAALTEYSRVEQEKFIDKQ
ncbi:cytochrome-c peroxidase [Marinobacter adhaerens]|jgi:mono/diheme cytochrome c family protein|uniref:cytochrome-c peroxidase n=1 Tax=Marinobacter adhaerens TaxID=1033846 RepID=UPI001E3F38B8|nr:cytochrome-c peroxidase [Marinobacter adhaerens]MCD1646489.1 cytochrome-c peroxidase [Marinobacter adhaerens]